MNDLNSIMRTYEACRQAQAQLNEGNKGAIFDALAAANITGVHVDFDGEGDSGQINGVAAFTGEDAAELPKTMISIRQIHYGSTEPFPTECRLEEAIETLCYGYLEQEHGGWENNDGAYRRVHASTWRNASIALEFNGALHRHSTPTTTRFEGGDHGTSLSSLALQREEMGRHRRRLSAASMTGSTNPRRSSPISGTGRCGITPRASSWPKPSSARRSRSPRAG